MTRSDRNMGRVHPTLTVPRDSTVRIFFFLVKQLVMITAVTRCREEQFTFSLANWTSAAMFA
jgi:hypothetical protein